MQPSFVVGEQRDDEARRLIWSQRAGYLRVFNLALDWLSAHRAHFSAPPAGRLPPEDGNDSERRAFGELAIACMVMSRSAATRQLPGYRSLVDHLLETVTRPDVFAGALRRQYLFYSALLACSALAACGRRDDRLRLVVERMLAMGYADRLDRTPWMQADFRLHLERAGFRHALPDARTIYRASILHALPAIPLLQSYDAYALTHMVFFLSDFGAGPLAPILADRYGAVCEYFELLLGTYAHSRHLDLVAEILMCLVCLERRESPLAGISWEMLAAAQDPSGFIRVSDDVTFQKVYHTTLVTLLASLLWYESS